MKILAFLSIIVSVMIVGCKSPTSPSAPAQAPADGTVFTFNGVSNYGTGLVTHTIRKTSDGFAATTSLGDETEYRTFDNGDIAYNCSCGGLELGVASHRSFHSNGGKTPTKYGGREVEAWVLMDSKYDGNEMVTVDSVAYDCAKVEVAYTIQPVDSSTTHLSAIWTYWYSPTLRYFTRIDTRFYYLDSVTDSSTMRLVSVK